MSFQPIESNEPTSSEAEQSRCRTKTPRICCVDERDEVSAETRGAIKWVPIPGLDYLSPFCLVLLHELIDSKKIGSVLLAGRGDLRDIHLINADLASFIEQVAFLLVDREEL